MPRFHFNVQDGRSDVDQDGTELRDVPAARAEALRLAGAIIDDAGRRGDLRMDFIVVESPAVPRGPIRA